jgi:AcrR family transcriptional regulator
MMPTSTTQRPQGEGTRPAGRMRKAERKKQLLAHAKQLFMELGYHATTTEKIANAAGVSEPVLYRHFESKKALFVEVLHEIRHATLERWHIEISRLSDPLAKLQALCNMYVGATRSQPEDLRVIHRTLLEAEDPEIASCLRESYLGTEEVLAKIIMEGQQAGVFRRSLDPRVGAWEMIRTGLGYALTLPLGIPLYQEADYLQRAIDCMLQCLLKTDV